VSDKSQLEKFKRAAKDAGVRVLSSHSLRHRKGHQFSDAGISVTTAATALGHSDPMITLTYYYPHDWATAKEALQNLATNTADLAAPSPKVVNFGR
jgi:integrase